MRRWTTGLLVVLVLAACKREEAPRPRVVEKARRAAMARAPRGRMEVGPRVVELAVYTRGPISPQAVERAQRRVRGAFPDLTVRDERSEEPGVYVGAPDIGSYAPPGEDRLEHSGRGLSPAEVSAVASAKGALVLSWTLAADPERALLRKAQGVALETAKAEAGFIWDEATREVFSPDQWRKQRIEGWDGALPDAQAHFTIHYYETDGGKHRAITLGLAKLGLPDLVIQDVPLTISRNAGHTINAVAQVLAEGAEVAAGGKLLLDLDAIRHRRVRETLLEKPLGDPPRKAKVDLAVAPLEPGDAENRLLELRFSQHEGETEVERLTSAMAALYGSSDSVTAHPANDPELEAIRLRVQARLPSLREAFKRGLPLGDQLAVKAPFTTDSGGVEWMWVTITGWDGDTIRGNLDNEPFEVAALRAGALVTVEQPKVADFLWTRKSGAQEGGESVRVLQRRQKTE